MFADDLAAIPLVDHHCHALANASRQAEWADILRAGSESGPHYPLADLKETLVAHAVTREIGEAAGRPDLSLEDLAPFLRSLDYPAYCRDIFHRHRYRHLMIDTGYAPPDAYDPEALAEVTGTAVHRILRLETMAESLLAASSRFDDWRDAFIDRIGRARSDGYIGAKSIVAYRSTLAIGPVSDQDARAGFERWRQSSPARLTEPTVLAYLLWTAAPLLSQHDLPLQFHSGYGDADEDLVAANPLLLRPFLQTFAPRGLKTVLLHTYPYHREAGYLASVYPHVYFDVSLIVPHGLSGARRIVAEALELAPVSRFLFASDAHTRPELFGLAARAYRDAVGAYLDDPVVTQWTTPEARLRWARMILHDNARAVYSLADR